MKVHGFACVCGVGAGGAGLLVSGLGSQREGRTGRVTLDEGFEGLH